MTAAVKLDKNILIPPDPDAELISLVRRCEEVFGAESDVLAALGGLMDHGSLDNVSPGGQDLRHDKSYRDIRVSALQRLVLLLADNDVTETLSPICDSINDERSVSRLISKVRTRLENAHGEKLVVVFYSEQGSLCSFYESESWEMFGCNANNERLKRYIRDNSPCSIIMIHSHPGRTLFVSEEDVRFTESIEEYAKMFGSVLTEHFVVSSVGNEGGHIGIIAEMKRRKSSVRYN